MDKIGDRIRKLREARDLTQEALGAASGYEQSTISKIEKGGRVSIRTVQAFARALGCTLEELVQGTDLEGGLHPEPQTAWDEAVARLHELHPDSDFAVTRCLWCTETTPAYLGARYTTLCSWECAAEVSRVYAHLGWPVNPEVMVTPLFLRSGMDGTHLYLNPDPDDVIRYENVPDEQLLEIFHRRRHERGPLRDHLLIERPELRAVLRGGGPTRRKSATAPPAADGEEQRHE